MCTLAFAYKMHSEYPFIFIGNRDEFYNRPTETARLWNRVVSGIDLEKGGTWTGITLSGRMAFLTNHRNFDRHVDSPESRGLLTCDFLLGEVSPETYLASLSAKKHLYNPYNLIVGDLNTLAFYSNIEDIVIKLSPGIYGLSNAFLDTEWPKVITIKKELANRIEENKLDTQSLFAILENDDQALDRDLPDTGINRELERSLSSIFIALEQYGTRHETLILIDRKGNVEFTEKSRSNDGSWEQNNIEFAIDPSDDLGT